MGTKLQYQMVLFSIKAKLTGAKPSSETQNKLNLKKAKQVVYLLDFFLMRNFTSQS